LAEDIRGREERIIPEENTETLKTGRITPRGLCEVDKHPRLGKDERRAFVTHTKNRKIPSVGNTQKRIKGPAGERELRVNGNKDQGCRGGDDKGVRFQNSSKFLGRGANGKRMLGKPTKEKHKARK